MDWLFFLLVRKVIWLYWWLYVYWKPRARTHLEREKITRQKERLLIRNNILKTSRQFKASEIKSKWFFFFGICSRTAHHFGSSLADFREQNDIKLIFFCNFTFACVCLIFKTNKIEMWMMDREREREKNNQIKTKIVSFKHYSTRERQTGFFSSHSKVQLKKLH